MDFGCTNAISVLREPAPRDLVDQPGALAPQLVERRPRCRHAIRDVMDAGPVRVTRNRPTGVSGAERAEQLDEGVADREQHLLDPLIVDAFTVDRLHPERPRVVLDRGLEVVDGDAHVVDRR